MATERTIKVYRVGPGGPGDLLAEFRRTDDQITTTYHDQVYQEMIQEGLPSLEHGRMVTPSDTDLFLDVLMRHHARETRLWVEEPEQEPTQA